MENVSDSNSVDRVRFAIYQCSSPAPDRAESEASALSTRLRGWKRSAADLSVPLQPHGFILCRYVQVKNSDRINRMNKVFVFPIIIDL